MSYTTSHHLFLSTDHIGLPGLLFEPFQDASENDTGKEKSVALYLHGNGSASVFNSHLKMHQYAAALTSSGIAFFGFNNRGAGYIQKLKRYNPTTFTDMQEVIEELKGGTALELIHDCIHDINGAIEYLRDRGYQRFFLIGESTGANKICVYHYYQPDNPVEKYVLLSGGDDTGLYYDMWGKEAFLRMLDQSKTEIDKGNGTQLIPELIHIQLMSWQSLYDTINPDGDYNIFPFNELFNSLRLSSKQLLREYRSIDRPFCVIYGGNDEFCYSRVPDCVSLLKRETQHPDNVTFHILPDADHGFTGHLPKLTRLITDWLVTTR